MMMLPEGKGDVTVSISYVHLEKVKGPTEMLDQQSRSFDRRIEGARHAKRNQELNNELQVKADELERLFAEHKLWVRGDESNSARRGRSVDSLIDDFPGVLEKELTGYSGKSIVVSSFCGNMEIDGDGQMKMNDDEIGDHGSMQNDSGLSEDSKGKFYERYKQKRDAKLRGEWGSKRDSREAEMEAMKESLEKSWAEMRTMVSEFDNGQDPALIPNRRASRAIGNHALNSTEQNKVQEQPQENRGDIIDNQDQISESSFNAIRTRPSLLPKPSSRAINGITKHQMREEQTVRRSAPKLPETRNDNAKCSSGMNKSVDIAKIRKYTRGRSTDEGTARVNEEKPRRSLSNSANHVTSTNRAPRMLDVAASKLLQEDTNRKTKPFLTKGRGIGPGAKSVAAKHRSSGSSSTAKDECLTEVMDPLEGSYGRSEEDEQIQVLCPDDPLETNEKLCSPELEFDEISQVNSHEEYEHTRPLTNDLNFSSTSTIPEFPRESSTSWNTYVESSFVHAQEASNVEASSWNTYVENSFAHAQEASNVEASLDSAVSSPASWSTNLFDRLMEADCAQEREDNGSNRRKLTVNASHDTKKKNIAKGLKRLLKFGRRRRDSMVTDWVSASTNSEGECEAEDDHDSGIRQSVDVPKSRIGLSQSHPVHESPPAYGISHEQGNFFQSLISPPVEKLRMREETLSGTSPKVPRSFFSLPTFWSKGSGVKA